MPTLGEKLRDARIERGMTQKELAGENVTRTMLSQIENDRALPSVQTVCYLAARLGIPVGYFLSDGEEAERYLRFGHAEKANEAYLAGDYNTAVREAKLLTEGDNERTRLLCASFYRLGWEKLSLGALKSAKGFFLQCQQAATKSPFPNPFSRPAALCLEYIRRLTDPESKKMPMPLFSDPEKDLVRITLTQKIRELCEDGQTAAARELMKRTEKLLPEEKTYLEAILAGKEGNPAELVAKCEQIQKLSIPVPARSLLYAAEEGAAVDTGDFHTAYKCASKRQKLEKYYQN